MRIYIASNVQRLENKFDIKFQLISFFVMYRFLEIERGHGKRRTKCFSKLDPGFHFFERKEAVFVITEQRITYSFCED